MTTELAQQLIKLSYAIAGVVAVVGAVETYVRMNNEDECIKRHIITVVLACIALVAAANIIEEIWL
jgi:uncharacterized membrane protein